jgi:hypothetical protein
LNHIEGVKNARKEVVSDKKKGFFSRWKNEYRKELEKSNGGKATIVIANKLENALGDVYEGATEAIDKFSGNEALAKTIKLVEQQRHYNDVLATRLAEALDEIKTLKARVVRLEEKNDCR